MTVESRGGGVGVLLMGYGSPLGPEDLPGYLTDVLGGRPPTKVMVEEYRRRYDLIGWSPQLRILTSLQTKLEERLSRDGERVPVFLGTKHWSPHIADTIPAAAAAGVRHMVAIPLSPYASPWILSPYQRAIEEGRQRAGGRITVDLRAGWHLNPHWVAYWADCLGESLKGLPLNSIPLLSAHSLPERCRRAGDAYPELLAETTHAIAEAAHLERWDFTYQSAGNATEPWLGPDITEKMMDWSSGGFPEQLVAPIGFVFDHLEVLYDLDVVVREFAIRHGVQYHRVPLPNDHPQMVDALRQVVRQALSPNQPSTPTFRRR